jgi:hypothetical protein
MRILFAPAFVEDLQNGITVNNGVRHPQEINKRVKIRIFHVGSREGFDEHDERLVAASYT